jgi:hypothetical protein
MTNRTHRITVRRRANAGRTLWGVFALMALGLTVRVVVALVSHESFDMRGFYVAGRGIVDWGLHFYAHDQPGSRFSPLPYPPGYLLWLAPVSRTGTAFRFLERLPPIAADIALVWLVSKQMRRAKSTPTAQLLGVALVALSPQLIVASARAGQIDSVAILATAGAVVLWDQGDDWRAVWAGLLIGVGTVLKTVPLVAVLALLPTARSRKEASILVFTAIAVPLIALAPFLAADAKPVVLSLEYHGLAGGGGISLFVQSVGSGAAGTLQKVGAPIAVGVLLSLCTYLRRHRVSAIPAMAMIWLTVYIFGLNWLAQYAVWGIPFFVMAGALWETAAFEAALVATSILDPSHHVGFLHAVAARLQHDLLVAVWVLIVAGWATALIWAAWVSRRTGQTGKVGMRLS